MINKIKGEASQMILEKTMELDQTRVREDLMGLYGDILEILSDPEQGRLIYTYTELMEREQRMLIPEAAYEAGLQSQIPDFERAFMDYIQSVYSNPLNTALLSKRDAMFYRLCDLLGDANGLMSEFNELYRKCFGILSTNIDRFFRIGFEQAYCEASEWRGA